MATILVTWALQAVPSATAVIIMAILKHADRLTPGIDQPQCHTVPVRVMVIGGGSGENPGGFPIWFMRVRVEPMAQVLAGQDAAPGHLLLVRRDGQDHSDPQATLEGRDDVARIRD